MPLILIYLSLWFLCSGNNAIGQTIGRYTIDIDKDLPSNNVYNATVDRLGYLWLSTDNGLARFNGYELKVFDLSQGFIRKDIWSLHEDVKGRMWISSISEHIGYIRNDTYHRVYTSLSGTFYPQLFMDYDSGIYFLTSFISNSSQSYLFCVEKNDTLFSYDISGYSHLVLPVSEKKLIAFDTCDNISTVEIVNGKPRASLCGKLKYATPKNENGNGNVLGAMLRDVQSSFKTNLLSHTRGGGYLNILNTATHTFRTFHLPKTLTGQQQRIQLAFPSDSVLNVITDTKLIRLDSNFNILSELLIDSLMGANTHAAVSCFKADPFWGNVICTKSDGVTFVYKPDEHFKKKSLELSGFSYAGGGVNAQSYWWNEFSHTLAHVTGNATTYKQLNLSGDLKVIPYKADTCLLLSTEEIYKLVLKDLALIPFLTVSAIEGLVADKHTIYCLSKFNGFYRTDLDKNINKRIRENYIIKGRFKGLIYDSLRASYWVYNYSKICMCKPDGRQIILGRKELEQRKFNSIRKILIDNRYGNIFVTEDRRLLVGTSLDSPFMELFTDHVFKDVKVAMQGNTLVVAGAFGVLFSKILGKGNVSAPVVYQNPRRLTYKIVHDIHFSAGQVLMNTDNGVYTIDVPASYPDVVAGGGSNYKTILVYGSVAKCIKDHDTIAVTQSDNKIQFDIIKPDGSKGLTFFYSLDNENPVWHELNKNELSLPALEAGGYYTLSVFAQDDEWRSRIVPLHLYIVPYWWQTPRARRLIDVGVILLTAFIVLAVIFITRRVVIKSHARKNQQLQLELNSVYSQLNPHFIFNSLGAAMYLIKTRQLDDAYNHIYKFANLLRAYIRSARVRYIELSEEIRNLRNYIELQQARFKNKFEYEIVLEPGVNTGKKIPSHLLQPLVENAINHGLLHKEEPGFVKIIFSPGNYPNELVCVVDDNGIGRALAGQYRDSSRQQENESYGNVLIKELCDVFNKYEKIKISIETIDKKAPETGTIVKLNLKYRNETDI